MKEEWNKGYWQANADLETEGNVLHWYTQASADFKVGYRFRVAEIESPYTCACADCPATAQERKPRCWECEVSGCAGKHCCYAVVESQRGLA